MACTEFEKIEIPTLAENTDFLPRYATLGAAGADVYACIEKELILPAGKSILVPTGMRVAIPTGYEIQVRPRSGLALNNQITVLNTPGTIDSDYRGEIGIILINHGKEDFLIKRGMRIAQLVVAAVVQAEFTLSQELLATSRNAGGFGHTGIY
jgi:dUTP pyrophosphatase